MTRPTVHEPALAELTAGFAGQVITSNDPAYDQARTIFNSMIDRRPAVIAQCETVQDVVKAVQFGREHGLEIAVRGGGHSVAGMALTDGGLVVDLRRMNTVTVDPQAGTARVGGGAMMSDLDRATQPYGLATTGGRVSTTGVGGFALGGGSGWLERKFGLACDNLVAVELVTADGRTVSANERENPELFWALHGGGGNFGVATSLTLRLHELPALTAAFLLWPAEAGRQVAGPYRDFIGAAPDEVGGGYIYLTGPPEEFVPEHLVGTLACGVLVTYTGTENEAMDVLAPLLAERPDGKMIAEHLDTLPDQALDLFCARADDMIVPSPSQHVLFPQGGAVARSPADYPVPWRHSSWVVHPFGLWEDPADDARAIQWAHDIRADVEPWSSGAVYLNFIGDEGQERVVAGLGAENYRRLSAVKTQYDPDNVFHLNHHIKPG